MLKMTRDSILKGIYCLFYNMVLTVVRSSRCSVFSDPIWAVGI